MNISLKKFFKKNNGITLVSLVITIIVLLILAGISLTAITGDNGIIKKAKESKKSAEQTAVIEQIHTEVIASMGVNNVLNVDMLINKLKNIDGISCSKTGDGGLSIEVNKIEMLVDVEGNINEVTTVTTPPTTAVTIMTKYQDASSSNKVAVIPKGFKVSSRVSEQNINNGLVVIDSLGNEFVWVPVEKNSLTQPDTNWETMANTATDSADVQNGITTEELKKEYDAMFNSINKNGGFYVARYKTKMEGNIVKCTPAQKSETGFSYKYDWYTFYKAQKDGYSSSSVGSSMIWATQRTQLINWIKTTSGYTKTTTTTPDINKAYKNIYGLESKYPEWLIESKERDATISRKIMGTNNGGTSFGVEEITNWVTTGDRASNTTGIASRITLYIK
ncbi:MAG: hypothetical protein HFJ17_06205 [Clostridia bacterium]|nr:hypothetical protein [Clostridia bacterium]